MLFMLNCCYKTNARWFQGLVELFAKFEIGAPFGSLFLIDWVALTNERVTRTPAENWEKCVEAGPDIWVLKGKGWIFYVHWDWWLPVDLADFILFTRCTIRLSIQIHGYLKVAAYRGHVLLAFHIQSMLNRGSHYYFGSPMIYLI